MWVHNLFQKIPVQLLQNIYQITSIALPNKPFMFCKKNLHKLKLIFCFGEKILFENIYINVPTFFFICKFFPIFLFIYFSTLHFYVFNNFFNNIYFPLCIVNNNYLSFLINFIVICFNFFP